MKIVVKFAELHDSLFSSLARSVDRRDRGRNIIQYVTGLRDQ